MALTGVTGHQVKIIGKIRATVCLDDKEIRHTMHVVRDDFLSTTKEFSQWILYKSTKLKAIKKTTIFAN